MLSPDSIRREANPTGQALIAEEECARQRARGACDGVPVGGFYCQSCGKFARETRDRLIAEGGGHALDLLCFHVIVRGRDRDHTWKLWWPFCRIGCGRVSMLHGPNDTVPEVSEPAKRFIVRVGPEITDFTVEGDVSAPDVAEKVERIRSTFLAAMGATQKT